MPAEPKTKWKGKSKAVGQTFQAGLVENNLGKEALVEVENELEGKRHFKPVRPYAAIAAEHETQLFRIYLETKGVVDPDKVISKNGRPVTLSELKGFLDARTKTMKTPSGGSPALGTLSTIWTNLLFHIERVKGQFMSDEDKEQMQTYLRGDLKVKFNLQNQVNEKETANLEDFLRVVQGIWSSEMVFSSHRSRLSFHAFFLLYVLSVSRPGETTLTAKYLEHVDGLKYSDLLFTLRWVDDRVMVFLKIRFRNLKGMRQDNSGFKEVLLAEEDLHYIGYDPVAAFLALAFMDSAFEVPNRHEDLLAVSEAHIRSAGGELRLGWKSEVHDKYILREATNINDVDALPIRYSTIRGTLHRVYMTCGYLVGTNTLFYPFRRLNADIMASAGLNDTEIGAAFGHRAESKVFRGRYLSRVMPWDSGSLLTGRGRGIDRRLLSKGLRRGEGLPMRPTQAMERQAREQVAEKDEDYSSLVQAIVEAEDETREDYSYDEMRRLKRVLNGKVQSRLNKLFKAHREQVWAHRQTLALREAVDTSAKERSMGNQPNDGILQEKSVNIDDKSSQSRTVMTMPSLAKPVQRQQTSSVHQPSSSTVHDTLPPPVSMPPVKANHSQAGDTPLETDDEPALREVWEDIDAEGERDDEYWDEIVGADLSKLEEETFAWLLTSMDGQNQGPSNDTPINALQHDHDAPCSLPAAQRLLYDTIEEYASSFELPFKPGQTAGLSALLFPTEQPKSTRSQVIAELMNDRHYAATRPITGEIVLGEDKQCPVSGCSLRITGKQIDTHFLQCVRDRLAANLLATWEDKLDRRQCQVHDCRRASHDGDDVHHCLFAKVKSLKVLIRSKKPARCGLKTTQGGCQHLMSSDATRFDLHLARHGLLRLPELHGSAVPSTSGKQEAAAVTGETVNQPGKARFKSVPAGTHLGRNGPRDQVVYCWTCRRWIIGAVQVDQHAKDHLAVDLPNLAKDPLACSNQRGSRGNIEDFKRTLSAQCAFCLWDETLSPGDRWFSTRYKASDLCKHLAQHLSSLDGSENRCPFTSCHGHPTFTASTLKVHLTDYHELVIGQKKRSGTKRKAGAPEDESDEDGVVDVNFEDAMATLAKSAKRRGQEIPVDSILALSYQEQQDILAKVRAEVDSLPDPSTMIRKDLNCELRAHGVPGGGDTVASCVAAVMTLREERLGLRPIDFMKRRGAFLLASCKRVGLVVQANTRNATMAKLLSDWSSKNGPMLLVPGSADRTGEDAHQVSAESVKEADQAGISMGLGNVSD